MSVAEYPTSAQPYPTTAKTFGPHLGRVNPVTGDRYHQLSSMGGHYREWSEIVSLVRTMQEQRGPTIERMRQILLRYEGDWIIPLPDLPTEPTVPLLTPALVGEMIDNFGIRAASVAPMIGCPALDPTKPSGVRSLDYANRRQSALEATYFQSMWPLANRRLFRHLSAYSTFAVIVTCDHDNKMPRVRVRDPLSAYPEHRSFEEMRRPEYTAFVMTHSAEYLRATFPQCRMENGGTIPTSQLGAGLWDVVEWYDCEQTRFGILGPAFGTEVSPRYSGGRHQEVDMPLCDPLVNELGYNPVICPEGPSLGKIAQRLAALLGMIDYGAKLMALDIVAQEKATFPDTYAIAADNQIPSIVGGKFKDGRTGEMNLLQGVSSVGVLRTSPDPRSGQMVDTIERSFRSSTGMLGMWGGENNSALRTGRAQETLSSIAIDPRIQEMHEMTQMWMPLVNETILDLFKLKWPRRKYEMFSGLRSKGLVEFTPGLHIETTRTTWQYPIPGADIIQLTQILGSMAGAHFSSLDTVRELHPWVRDPDDEKQKIMVQRLEDALMEAIMVAVQNQALPLPAVAYILKEINDKSSLVDAIQAAEKHLQRLQATAAPPPVDPNMVAPPESMPGLAGGPGGMQQPQTTPPGEVEVPQNAQRLQQIMAAMRTQGAPVPQQGAR